MNDMRKIIEEIKTVFRNINASLKEEPPKTKTLSSADEDTLNMVSFYLSEMANASIDKGEPIDGKKIKHLSETMRITLLCLR